MKLSKGIKKKSDKFVQHGKQASTLSQVCIFLFYFKILLGISNTFQMFKLNIHTILSILIKSIDVFYKNVKQNISNERKEQAETSIEHILQPGTFILLNPQQ